MMKLLNEEIVAPKKSTTDWEVTRKMSKLYLYNELSKIKSSTALGLNECVLPSNEYMLRLLK